MTPAIRILVAGIQESNQRLSQLLSDCDVTFVETMTEAKAALVQQYDVILVAVRFDESRMFDLLRHLKSDSGLARIPVICYRSAPGPVTATELARQAVELACFSLGANDFVDLVSDSDSEHANFQLRDSVFRAIAGSRNDSPE